MPSVLIIEPDHEISEPLRLEVEQASHSVVVAKNWERGLEVMIRKALLDQLPDAALVSFERGISNYLFALYLRQHPAYSQYRLSILGYGQFAVDPVVQKLFDYTTSRIFMDDEILHWLSSVSANGGWGLLKPA
ncbi:hypothetical protein HYV81_01865 [Candidatus Woesearchaeota archaeon]|nr:hypothetical protein [Candidatus Woesearchaeota archaeon]